MKLPPQLGLGALQPVALGFRQRLAGAVFRCLAMINSMPLLAKTRAAAIGSRAGMRELEPAGGVNPCGRYDGRAAPFGLLPQGPGTFISGRFLIRFGPWTCGDLQRGSALKRGAKLLGLKSLGLKSLWCHVAMVCRYGEHWSDAGWLP
jgi:hypothetical protein